MRKARSHRGSGPLAYQGVGASSILRGQAEPFQQRRKNFRSGLPTATTVGNGGLAGSIPRTGSACPAQPVTFRIRTQASEKAASIVALLAKAMGEGRSSILGQNEKPLEAGASRGFSIAVPELFGECPETCLPVGRI